MTAAIGLVENSVVILVASMLISPLMVRLLYITQGVGWRLVCFTHLRRLLVMRKVINIRYPLNTNTSKYVLKNQCITLKNLESYLSLFLVI